MGSSVHINDYNRSVQAYFYTNCGDVCTTLLAQVEQEYSQMRPLTTARRISEIGVSVVTHTGHDYFSTVESCTYTNPSDGIYSIVETIEEKLEQHEETTQIAVAAFTYTVTLSYYTSEEYAENIEAVAGITYEPYDDDFTTEEDATATSYVFAGTYVPPTSTSDLAADFAAMDLT